MSVDLATIQINVDTTQIGAANDSIAGLGREGEKTEKKVSSSNKKMVGSFGGLKNAIGLVGSAMAALGVAALGRSFATTINSIDNFKGSLVTATGSIAAANEKFNELLNFSSNTPFTLDQSIRGFTRLKNLGLDPSEASLRSYGNTAAAMGKDLNQMIEAVADASTMEFERLKEFGIKAKQQSDTVTFTFQGIETTVGRNAQEIARYLQDIGNVNFAGAMEQQMNRLPGAFSKLQDNITRLYLAIADVGGLRILSGAIEAASSAIFFLTNNLDLLAAAVIAAGSGLLVAFGPALISAIASAGAAMAALAASPAGIVAAVAGAVFLIVKNWDEVKHAALSAALLIEIGWNNLKLFFIESFANALNSIFDLFSDVKNEAIATWTAIKAATLDPLNAIETFNSTFDNTIEALRSGQQENRAFSGAVQETKQEITALENELVGLIIEHNNQADATDAVNGVLSEFEDIAYDAGSATEVLATEVQTAAQNTDNLTTKTAELLAELLHESDQLYMTGLEIEIYNNLKKAGVTANSELGQAIIETTTKLHEEKEAYKAGEEASREAARVARESAEEKARAYEEMKNKISGFFVDLFNNGRDAFDNLLDRWKNLILEMIAQWLASGITDLFSNLLGGNGILQSFSSAFSGMLSSISSGVSSLVSSITGLGNAATEAIVSGGTAAVTPAIVSGGTAAVTPAIVAGTAGTSPLAAAFTANFPAAGTAGAVAAPTVSAAAPAVAPAAAPTASSGLSGILKTVGPAAVFAYLAYKWDVFGLNKIDYPTFEELPVDQQLSILGTRYRQSFAESLGVEDTEGQLAYDPTLQAEFGNALKQAYGSAADQLIAELGLTDMIDGSFREGLSRVPHDGFVAELHAGERVLTAEQTMAADRMSMDMGELKQTMEEIMLAVARNTQRLYRINDRWDKDGLPPTRA